MAVYVDQLFQHGSDSAPRCFRRRKSCHMYADTLKELHAMATSIGLKREWFQDHKSMAHYDLVESRRIAAIQFGAIEHNKYQMVNFMRASRGELPLPHNPWV